MSETKDKSINSLKKNISKLVTIISIVIFAYSLFSLIKIYRMYSYNEKVLSEVQEVYEQLSIDDVESTLEIEERKIRQQFDELHTINEEIVGWIKIADTKIDYPIVQAEDNAHYLNRNYRNELTPAGSIFMDYRNDVGTNDSNIIIYGHRMRDKSMFDSLEYFLDEDFFNNHGVIQFDTMYESYEAEVFAAYSTTTDFDYIQTEFELGTDYLTLVHRMKQQSQLTKAIDIGMDDQIITLSTCDYLLDPNKGRLVVHAKLMKRS